MPTKRASSPSPRRMPKQAKKAFLVESNSDCSSNEDDGPRSVSLVNSSPSPHSNMPWDTVSRINLEPADKALAKKTDKSHQASNAPSFDPNNSVLNSSRIQTFLVGPTKARFSAHRNVLEQIHAGNFLHAARTNGFKKLSDIEIKIPKDDPKAFGIFVRWLYGLSLGLGSAKESISSVADSQSCIDIYIFAEKYHCFYLQDLVMSNMHHCASQGRKFATELSQNSLQQFVTNVPHSHMHTLLAKWIAKDISLGDIKKEDTAFDMVPTDLLRTILREMHGCARAGQAQPSLGDPCDYHHHIDGSICAFR